MEVSIFSRVLINRFHCIRQMLTTSWGEPESVKWMNNMYTVIISINVNILQRFAEKQIVTKQEYKIIRQGGGLVFQ